MEMTEDQKKAHDLIMDWFKTTHQRTKYLTLGGYAGTGKTTLLGILSKELKDAKAKIAFCTVSGKASTVLKSKLSQILTEEDYCGTIHSLIYRLIGKEKLRSGRTELYFQSQYVQGAKIPYDLLIIDEASMVNEWMFRDLLAYGIPILAVGDHGQLPPVKGNFNLMQSPDIRLEKIMRQAEGDPIIRVAQMARETGKIEYGSYGPYCIKTRDVRVLHDHDFAGQNSIMLCALNKTRIRMNSFAREILKRNNPVNEFNFPVVGEPLICLYNNHKKMIYNGNIGILKRIECQEYVDHESQSITDVFDVDIDMGDFTFSNLITRKQFGKEYTHVDEKNDDIDYFDFGYVITTHKAQGSEWRNVLVMEEGEFMFKGEMWNRWLYTAITRAKENLVIYKR